MKLSEEQISQLVSDLEKYFKFFRDAVIQKEQPGFLKYYKVGSY